MKTMNALIYAALFLLLAVTQVHAERLGSGIFQKMHYAQKVNHPSLNSDNPYLAGAEFIYNWAELEPQRGTFRWELIESVIAPWASKKKKVILSFGTVQQKGINPTASSATPPWVFAGGAEKIEFRGATRPVFWDPVFLKAYDLFVSGLAEKFDGNPDIEFINMGIGEFGTTKIAGNKRVLQEYRKKGYTEAVWSDTIKKIIDIYTRHFSRTRVVLTLSPFYNYVSGGYGDGSEVLLKGIVEYAAGKGVYIYNHSLSGNPEFARNPFLPWYAQLTDKYKDVRIILGTDNPTVTTRKYGDIGDIMKNAFGGEMVGGVAVPPTHVKYLIFYPKDISAGTKGDALYDERYDAAFLKASEKLRRN